MTPEQEAKNIVRKLDSFKCAYVDSVCSKEEADLLLEHDSKILASALKQREDETIERCVRIALDQPLEEIYISNGNYSGEGISKLLHGIRSLIAEQIRSQ